MVSLNCTTESNHISTKQRISATMTENFRLPITACYSNEENDLKDKQNLKLLGSIKLIMGKT